MIQAIDLSKRYGDVEAVKGVGFTVEDGSVVGLLGPNGAGKTTIMKALTGYHYPSSGHAIVDGIDVAEDPLSVKRRVGYLPESVPLYTDLTPLEYLGFIAEARGMKRPAAKEAIEAAVGRCGLEPVVNRPIEQLSKGFRQRVGLAQAILHDPPVLILDEPTTGLDPNQILEIRDLIRSLGSSKTVMISTHILQEVEAVCSRVLILNEGRIAAQGSPAEIAATMKGGDRFELILFPADRAAAALGSPPAGAETLSAKEADGASMATIAFPGAEDRTNAEAIFDWAVASGLKILGMERRRISLEEIFVKLTREGDEE